MYEIHITVKHRASFVDDCYELGIKPIIIDLGSDTPSHSMTSSTVTGNDEVAFATAHNFASLFRDRGYVVERIKIETVPWHPKANSPDPGQYFETHFAIRNMGDNRLIDEVLKNATNLHRSRNLLKKGNDTVQMATYRSKHYRTSNEYLQDVDCIKAALISHGLELDKVISEFALYDTNVEMDHQWLKTKQL